MSNAAHPNPHGSSLLIAGLDQDLVQWIGRRLPEGVEICPVSSAEELRTQLIARVWSLLLIEDRLPDASLEDALHAVRAIHTSAQLQIVCIMNAGERRRAGRLIENTGIHRLMFQPLDREELANQLASLLSVQLRPLDPTSTAIRTGAAIAQLWVRFRPQALERVAILEEALAALNQGSLDAALCQAAEKNAHKLAGSVGTFGFASASVIARKIEHIFQDGLAAAAQNHATLRELIPALRPLLEAQVEAASGSEPAAPSAGSRRPSLLVVDHDPGFATQLIHEAALKGLRATHVSTHDQARTAIAGQRPQAVILSLSFPGGKEHSLNLLKELEQATPPIPTLVLTEQDDFNDRIQIARLGGEGALSKTQSLSQILEWMSVLLDRLNATRARVLAVDDDPQVLSTVRALLEPHGVLLTSIENPLNFWEAMDEVSPDLIMLDVQMPHISGLELCRLVRGDPRWSSTPVLFLTAQTDTETVQRIFSAGADDYVSKPIVGPELVTRIANRLERTQLYRTLAETDALTKVSSRRKSIQVIRQFLKLSSRHRQPFCLAIIDVDRFKQINDVYGHSLGDLVLQQFGQLLLRYFRSEDIVGRWGGDEFVVGMYGMKGDAARQRLVDLLEELKAQEFGEPGEAPFSVTFTAGIAESPLHGRELQHLYLAADRALYAQKEAGRGRVGLLDESGPGETLRTHQAASM